MPLWRLLTQPRQSQRVHLFCIALASAVNPCIERTRARLVSDLQSIVGSREPIAEKQDSSPFRKRRVHESNRLRVQDSFEASERAITIEAHRKLVCEM